MLWHYKGRGTLWNADEAKENSSDLHYLSFPKSRTTLMDFILLGIYQQNYIFCIQFQDVNLNRRYLA